MEKSLDQRIDCYRKNYETLNNDQFFNLAYTDLTSRTKWRPVEYIFLCWLNYYKKLRIPFEKPQLPDVRDISLSELKKTFLITEKRRDLFDTLEKYVNLLKSKYALEELTLFIGGSFVEPLISEPKDIDVIFLVPADSSDELHEEYQIAFGLLPGGIDPKFLPVDFTFDRFKAYLSFIYLGNNAKSREEFIDSNQFKERSVVKIVM